MPTKQRGSTHEHASCLRAIRRLIWIASALVVRDIEHVLPRSYRCLPSMSILPPSDHHAALPHAWRTMPLALASTVPRTRQGVTDEGSKFSEEQVAYGAPAGRRRTAVGDVRRHSHSDATSTSGRSATGIRVNEVRRAPARDYNGRLNAGADLTLDKHLLAEALRRKS